MQEEENSQAQEQPQQPHQPQRGEAAGAAATPAAAPSTSRGTSGGSPGRNQSGASSSTQKTKNVITFFPLQLSEYETDPYFLQLSQNMATNCLLIFVFLPVLI